MSGYCFACNNTGWRDCYCGGDLCICDNYGEYECTACDGAGPEDDYDDVYDGYEYGPEDGSQSPVASDGEVSKAAKPLQTTEHKASSPESDH